MALVFKHFDNVGQLQILLAELIEKTEEKHLQLATRFSTEESKRIYSIGHLDLLKDLKSLLT